MSGARDNFKELAAREAVKLAQPGMVLGLGHGSTVEFALQALAERVEAGELNGIIGIPASSQTEARARELGIPLGDFNEHPHIDLTLDGADEVDRHLNLIKGGGGALLREKLLAQASQRVAIMVDESKLSPALGTKFALPLEVLPFGWAGQLDFLVQLGGQPQLRLGPGKKPVNSDQGNYILDCDFGAIQDLEGLARRLEARPGILEHGLFLGLATDVYVGGEKGVGHHKSS